MLLLLRQSWEVRPPRQDAIMRQVEWKRLKRLVHYDVECVLYAILYVQRSYKKKTGQLIVSFPCPRLPWLKGGNNFSTFKFFYRADGKKRHKEEKKLGMTKQKNIVINCVQNESLNGSSLRSAFIQ